MAHGAGTFNDEVFFVIEFIAYSCMMKVHRYRLKLIFVFFFLIQNMVFGQNQVDVQKQKLFNQAFEAYKLDNSKLDHYGKQMLSYAQTNYEKSLALNIIAENYLMKSDFVTAVNELEKSWDFISKTDSLQQKVRTLGTLASAYRQAGLISESDIQFQNFKKEVAGFPEPIKSINLSFTEAKLYDIDGDNCKAGAARKKFVELMKPLSADNESQNTFMFANYVQLVYNQLKCSNSTEARASFEITESYLKKIPSRENLLMYEFYLLDKALFANAQNDKINAKKYFDQAYKQCDFSEGTGVRKLILEERLEAEVDSPEEQLSYAKILNDLLNKETKATKALTSKESSKAQKIIEESERKEKMYHYILIVSVAGLSILIFLYYNRNKALRKKYEAIIQEIEKEEVVYDHVKTETADPEIKTEVIKNDETEQEILKQLQSFEKKKLYLTKGISTAQMAVMLKTNTKYLSHVLKKYRNSDFYNYINSQRINYIAKELHDEPSLLNLKIAAIAEMCGYNSHSQFASIFKSVKGISPSQYISFLNENKAK